MRSQVTGNHGSYHGACVNPPRLQGLSQKKSWSWALKPGATFTHHLPATTCHQPTPLPRKLRYPGLLQDPALQARTIGHSQGTGRQGNPRLLTSSRVRQ